MLAAVPQSIPLRDTLPGLACVAVLVAAGYAAGAAVSGVSAPVVAFLLGVALAPVVRRASVPVAGIRLASKTLLRAGIAVLGFSIAAPELASLGLAGVAIAATTVVVTLLATIAFGRTLGIDRDLALLIGAGSSICGAAAIAAVETALERPREREVAYALLTVTLFGTVAMFTTPLLARYVFDLDTAPMGVWVGASVHEVAQVAGAGALLTTGALQVAVLAKLTRVVLLAPAVAVIAAARAGRRTALRVPGFVVAFFLLVALRSVLDVTDPVADTVRTLSMVLLAAGLAGMGLQIVVSDLAGSGARPLLLGLAAWLVASCTALALALVLL